MNKKLKEFGALLMSKYWIDNLSLEDWKIDFRFGCSPDEFENPDNLGECLMNKTRKLAIVKLKGEEYLTAEDKLDFDIEQVLVHELLHIKFCFVTENITNSPADSLLYDLHHQLINDLAWSLVNSRRTEFKSPEKVESEEDEEES